MNEDRIKALYFALCYRCFTELHTIADCEGGTRNLENLRIDTDTLHCRKCGSFLSITDLISIQNIAQVVESDFIKWFGVRPWLIAWSKNKSLIDRLGVHYQVTHGWEPYFMFILVSALSGIIGNARYEYIRKFVKPLFERCYRDNSIDLNNHLDLVLKYYRGETSEFTGKISRWRVPKKVGITIRKFVNPSKQEILDQVLNELQETFKKITADILYPRGLPDDAFDSALTANNQEK
ncbi:MAG: hypothetical protein HF978_12625 [Desulfobacteraceae bacterium]|nr:hypothetical protein [Desulfobacteraceae bacterium]MBC2756383.1 hypothetical protein [Desulfobacteraceae bacterium]